MIQQERTIPFDDSYLRLRGIEPSTCFFFDIETTGFKAGSSHLYLIGVAYQTVPAPTVSGSAEEGAHTWCVRQWLSASPQQEASLLRAFSELACQYQTVIHFNGNRFDIPYLTEKYAQYQLPNPFDSLHSLDLYEEFRPYKARIALDHMNQKAIERFLGLYRKDQYDGGRLIPVYRNFCKTYDAALLELLLLHNLEDVTGMLHLSSMYGFLFFFDVCSHGKDTPNSDADARSIQVSHARLLTRPEGAKQLLVHFTLPAPVPVAFRKQSEIATVTIKDRTGSLLVPVLQDVLYYYFADWHNYYYLPLEDMAIHKSVATYVDKEFRVHATADTCYTRVAGSFLPQTETLQAAALKRCRKDAFTWFPFEEEILEDTVFLNQYVSMLLRWLFPVPKSTTQSA